MNRRSFFTRLFKTAAVVAVAPGVVGSALQYHDLPNFTFMGRPIVVDENCPRDIMFFVSDEIQRQSKIIMRDLNRQWRKEPVCK